MTATAAVGMTRMLPKLLLIVGLPAWTHGFALSSSSRTSLSFRPRGQRSTTRSGGLRIFREFYLVSTTRGLSTTRLWYRNDTATTAAVPPTDFGKKHRFARTASSVAQLDAPCILVIHGQRYNLTAWARAHPGGDAVLRKFHKRGDEATTRAFEAASHSAKAYEMLQDFLIVDENSEATGLTSSGPSAAAVSVAKPANWRQRWRRKLFTREDPIGVHKYLGIFCLVHFAVRFLQMYFGNPAAGLGKGASLLSLACLAPHLLLSVSSLIFPTVPRERVVGKPMIWKEFRIHNILFGVRSVITAALAALAIHRGHALGARRMAVLLSCLTVLLAQIGADVATKKLQPTRVDSTTATMPYWEGCSVATQKRFKSFYAYSQFMATLACLAVSNPAWPLSVLLAIQGASLLLTLVRKGLISAKQYHVGYTVMLIMPYFVGLRSLLYTRLPDFAGVSALALALYQLRRRGVNKYALWIPVLIARILWGDAFLSYGLW